MNDVLKEFIALVLEGRRRDLSEVDLADGRKVEFGSPEHISDLNERISDMARYRDKHGRGTAARESYARTISRLRTELKRAQRAAEGRLSEVEHGRKKRRK